MRDEMWFEEINGNEKRSYRIVEELCEIRSKYQKIEIFKLANQGITLVLDGKARVFEIDEYIYHEGITYPALNRHPDAKFVLVIGDGDGGIIRELLKYDALTHIDWVEIDKKVIEVCERFLPSFPSHYRNDKRVNLIIADGLKYLADCNIQYDVVYISVTEECACEYSGPLHRESTYKLIKKVLKSDGVATLSFAEFSPSSFSNYRKRIHAAEQWFDFVDPFYVGLPSFGSNWGLALCCDVKREYTGRLQIDNLRYYGEEEDPYLFHLPKYLK